MRFVDELLQQAEARGEFKNLPGQGRPLNLEQNPYAGENQMAYKIVKDAGYSLAFIEERQKLVEQIDNLRKQLRQPTRPLTRPAIDDEIAKLNRAIQLYNLKAPHTQFHIMPLDAEWEIVQAQT